MNTTPISREQLTALFSKGCKPEDEWRVGTEHEKIGFCIDTLRPIPYAGTRSIKSLLELLSEYSGTPVFEAGNIISIQRGLASVTLEPGGQLELSGAPVQTIHETCRETRNHLALLKEATSKLGIGFLGLGFQPKWHRDEIPWMPKARYAVMKAYMPMVGNSGLDMMLRTATVQANLDFSSEADMSRKMRVACCLQPLVTALCAASPFVDGKPSGFLSSRAACWLDTDPARTGIPECIFEDDFGFEHYAKWALDAPMYFIVRNGQYVNCSGQSFRDFLHGRLPALPGELPTMDDWELHVGTLFPEVRLKQFLEMRGADAGLWPWVCSLPALWKGLLYDEVALEKAWNLCAAWSHTEVSQLRRQAPRSGFATPFRDSDLHALCESMLDIARGGLERINALNSDGENEASFLEPMIHAVTHKKTQADTWLDAYHGHWDRNIDRIFIEAIHP
ncbi:MAG: glutamate--cysteine ligase [Mariprofundaceae bacterium]|nr:glutamate--cysteine ligase [Mariprofundaceae bacterium]